MALASAHAIGSSLSSSLQPGLLQGPLSFSTPPSTRYHNTLRSSQSSACPGTAAPLRGRSPLRHALLLGLLGELPKDKWVAAARSFYLSPSHGNVLEVGVFFAAPGLAKGIFQRPNIKHTRVGSQNT